MRVIEKKVQIDFTQSFQSGNPDCFADMFKLLYASACHFAVRLVKNEYVAQDIVEESFEKIWQRRTDFSHINVLKSYLYTSIHNAAINWLKANERENRKTYAYMQSLASEETRLDSLVTAETYRELSAALDRLPVQSRQIINMIFMEGKKTSQVAEQLNISAAHVSTQKKRGLLLLRKFMPPQFIILMSLLFSAKFSSFHF